MSISRFPTYLTLIHRGEPRTEAPVEAARPREVYRPGERDLLTGVATRSALLERLEVIGSVAPNAALSFVLVKVDGLGELNREQGLAAGDELLHAVAARIRELTRATDAVGRLTGASFGIVLQGTGATASGAVAARLAHHLSRLVVNGQPAPVRVSVATGRGVNADTLVVAAADTLSDCG